MKKTIILVALMLLGDMRLSAQAPILPLDTNLYYDWWWYDDLMSDTAQYIYTNVADGSYTGDSNYDASGHDVGFVRRGFWHYQAVIGGGVTAANWQNIFIPTRLCLFWAYGYVLGDVVITKTLELVDIQVTFLSFGIIR